MLFKDNKGRIFDDEQVYKMSPIEIYENEIHVYDI